VLIDELLVVGDQGLGDGLADGVELGSVTTTGDTDADVDIGELVEAEDEERLVDLEERMSVYPDACTELCVTMTGGNRESSFSGMQDGVCSCLLVCIGGDEYIALCSYLEAEDLGLDQGERSAVDLDETVAGL
jgi:hypothetical protein